MEKYVWFCLLAIHLTTTVSNTRAGYYRVNYEPDMWTSILTALKAANHSGIHVSNRAQVRKTLLSYDRRNSFNVRLFSRRAKIVDDVLNLARADYVDYTLALQTVQYLEQERHYLPWLAAFNNLAYVYRRIGGAANRTEYQKWMIRLSEHAFQQLSFNESSRDSQLDINNRANILSHRCKYGSSECIEAAQRMFEPLRSDESQT